MGAAARATDMHTCPMSDGPKPHVGGPILPGGNTTVLVGGMPAAVVDDNCVCAGASDALTTGSSSVFIAGKPAVRMGDPTAHGGTVTVGCPTVMIGG